MIWKIDDDQGNESKKIVWEAAPYLKGKGLDLGAGMFKVLPHVIAIDNGHHNAFGHTIRPDIMIETCEALSMFASQSFDFVYSSHLLEHIQDYKATLKEWWRLVKVGGYLVLYLPHKNFYPNIGQLGANPDHKHDFLSDDIIEVMKVMPMMWDLVDNQDRNDDAEYSMFLVFKKINGPKYRMSYKDPKPEKTALVCRFGAFGDLLQASSVFAGLKAQGFHVTLMASEPGVDVVRHDPNIDKFMLLDKDQIPNPDLSAFWEYTGKKYDRFVNLSESVEGTWLALPGRTQHSWAPVVRHHHMNFNYLEFQHQIAKVPHKPNVKFFATSEEKQWAAKTRSKMDKLVVLWSLSGSSVHKTWAGLDSIIASLMLTYKNVDVVLVGGVTRGDGSPALIKLTDGRVIHELEAGWQDEPRVHLTCGKWSIRETMAFLPYADLIIGPETGVLNAASGLSIPKICFLSHSSVENLTRDWVNTVSMYGKGTRCKGRDSDEVTACHVLHYGWAACTKNDETGTAQCQKDIDVKDVWVEVENVMAKVMEQAA